MKVFDRPNLTADIVLLSQWKTPEPFVLLVNRAHEPFAGSWALPGGFVNRDETVENAARRELYEETCLDINSLRQLQVFSKAGRDPRNWSVTVAFYALVDRFELKPKANDDAADVGWFSLEELPKLAFDHAEIIELARQKHLSWHNWNWDKNRQEALKEALANVHMMNSDPVGAMEFIEKYAQDR